MNRKGFTFIELLIALTIFSIIATSMYFTLNTGIKVWSRSNESIRENQRFRICFDIISKDLKNIIAYPPIKPEWGAERISFPAIVDTYEGDTVKTELVKVIFYFDDIKKGLVRVCATVKEGFDEAYAEEKILLDDIENLAFQYCYKIKDEERYEWKDTWGFDDKIPRGIRIKADNFEKTVFIPVGELGEKE